MMRFHTKTPLLFCHNASILTRSHKLGETLFCDLGSIRKVHMTHARASGLGSVRPTMCAQSDVDESRDIDKYNKWLKEKQTSRTKSSSALATDLFVDGGASEASSPDFDQPTLFHDGVEAYVNGMTSLSSSAFETVVEETTRSDLYAPCMVGRVEGQFLKMITQMMRARRILDIGTFTGYSALAFAEGLPANDDSAEVVTIEADGPTASVARKCIDSASVGKKIRLIEADAQTEVKAMAEAGEKFDIIFLDADKTNYSIYYDLGLTMLNEGGIIMADNGLGSLLFDKDDSARQSLHEFAQMVRDDKRVEQVMLTVREGILIARKV